MTKILFLDGKTVTKILQDKDLVLNAVRTAYLSHGVGSSSTPRSLFLRFPDRPGDRIIALLSRVKDSNIDVAGMKWVSSVPSNASRGLPRAGATILLNSMTTGFLKAVLSAAPVNAARTAAAAALTLKLVGDRSSPTIGVVGSGLIATKTLEYIEHVSGLGEVAVYDSVAARAESLADQLRARRVKATAVGLDMALRCDVVLLATTAASPHIDHEFAQNQILLHLSLRDLKPEILVDARNVVDDYEHASREETSLALAAEKFGASRLSVTEIPSLLRGESGLAGKGPIVCSPFGMGALDVATGEMVYRRAVVLGQGIELDLEDD